MIRLDSHLMTKNGLSPFKAIRTLLSQISTTNPPYNKSSSRSYYMSPTNHHRPTPSNSLLSKPLQTGSVLTLNKSSLTILPKLCHSTYSTTLGGDHFYHTSAKVFQIQSTEAKHPKVTIESGNVTVSLKDKTVEIPLLWLRDHCRCPRCYNHETCQKNVDVDLMQRDLEPTNVQVTGKEDLLVIECKLFGMKSYS